MDLLIDGPDDGPTLLLAHGAGAPMDSRWMNDVARLLAARGVRVVRFEFAYMASRRDGKRGGQPRAEAVLEEYRAAVAEVGGEVWVGGKSFGGRVASMVADDVGARGVVALGYPFHPPGKPVDLSPGSNRIGHLLSTSTPVLVCQGERDPFGTAEEVAGFGLPDSIELHWAPDGDHSLKPRKASGRTEAQNLADAADAIAGFTART